MEKSPALLVNPMVADRAIAHSLNFEDWARFISFEPRLYFKPAAWDELKNFLAGVLQGYFKPGNLRVLGSLHSCSEICVSDVIVDVGTLPRTIEFNGDNTMVTASANWSLHDFLLQLSARGKSLSATGGTDAQTLAGIISTNTAPATPKHTIYELLEWVEYLAVAEDGKSIVEKRVLKTDAAFPAVIGSLGAIGILTKVQFRLVDELYFAVIQKIVPLDEVLRDVASTSRQYDFWRVAWIPDTTKGLLWAAKKIPRGQADPDGGYKPDQGEGVLKFVFTMWDKIAQGAAGPLLDDVMKMVYKLMAAFYSLDEVEASGPLRNMLPVDRQAPLHVAMADWSFKPADLNDVLACCKEYYEQKGWPNLSIGIELSKTDNYFMSPWNWEGLDYVVKFNFMYMTDVCKTQQEKDQIRAHLRGLWNHLTHAGIQFKAHWGKINFMDYNFVRERYQLEQFQPFIHPMFLNAYLTERLRS